MISLITMILLLGIMFRICFWTIGFFGRMIGSLIGCVFYVFIGIIGFALFGLGLIIVPVVIVAAIGGIIYAITKTA